MNGLDRPLYSRCFSCAGLEQAVVGMDEKSFQKIYGRSARFIPSGCVTEGVSQVPAKQARDFCNVSF